MPYRKIISQLNIKNDDTVLIASNIMPLAISLKKNGFIVNADDFINVFQDFLQDNGTLLFPSFNYDFSNNIEYNYLTSAPQKMGSLSNTAFKRDDFIRTRHPVFSFSVWGKNAEKFHQLSNKEAFSLDSPFGLMYQLNAKMLFIDIDYNRSFTYVHFIEHMEKAFYRYHKEFTNFYTDEHGDKTERTYSIFVRDLEKNVKNSYNPLGHIFEKNMIAKKEKIFNCEFILLDLHKAYDIVKHEIKTNPKNLISYTS